MDGASRRGLAPPTVVDGLRTLAAVVGAPEALRLWSQAGLAAGVHGAVLEVPAHLRLVEALVALAPTPAARVAAVSHLTRLRAHQVLARVDREG